MAIFMHPIKRFTGFIKMLHGRLSLIRILLYPFFNKLNSPDGKPLIIFAHYIREHTFIILLLKKSAKSWPSESNKRPITVI
jgi:hypothetical protein